MNRVILMFSLHVAAVLARENISCNIPAVKPMETTSLVCKFPEDISLSKKDFSIHYINRTKPVVDCLWAQGKLECFNSPGYEINLTVTNQLTVWIHSASTNLTGEYYCKMSDSTEYDIQHCHLLLIPEVQSHVTAQNEEVLKENISLAIGLGIGLPAIAIIVIVLLLRKKIMSLIRPGSDHTEDPDVQAMIEKTSSDKNEPEATTSLIEESQNTVTKKFQAYLENEVKEMYPDIPTQFYFVPPIYFSKIQFIEQPEAGEIVYVRCLTKTNETEYMEYVNVLRHDRAMQHFLHCLHYLAVSEHEQMLVLTQFQYDDYLKSTPEAYAGHSLPIPSGLTEDSATGCFDFLIVHRHHGLMIGVLKAVKDDDAESETSQQKADEIINEITEAVKQLEKADRIIQHLISDQHQFPRICKALILPNLSHKSLLSAAETSESVVKMLRGCLGVKPTENPTERCLCSEDLSEQNTPWNVSSDVVSKIRSKWKWTINDDSSSRGITDEQYFITAARFFGPATQSILRVPKEYVSFRLPKTIAEAVSLTGDLYSRSTLPSNLEAKLNDPIVVLVGTPNTGKTRVFTIIGAKWLSKGCDIVIVKDTSSPSDSFLLRHLSALKEQNKLQSVTGVPYGDIFEEKCDLQKHKDIQKCVERIIENKGKENVYVLLDVAHLEGTLVKKFSDALRKKVSNLHLWISCTGSVSPAGLKNVDLTEILNCPPAVVRETSRQEADPCPSNNDKDIVSYLPPTDGPAVKHIYYKRSQKLLKSSQDCQKCGREVGSFLRDTLFITKLETEKSISDRQAPLKFKDILILFEFNRHFRFAKQKVNENCGFLKGLRESGIAVRVVNTDEVDDNDSDCALAMNVKRMQTHRTKSKIVVYVETNYEYAKDEENKRRALTSCTSQLIFVHSEQ